MKITLCDYLKTPIKDDQVFAVVVDGNEFEVGQAGKKALLKQLEGEDAPGTPKVEVVERVVHRDAPPPPLQSVDPGGVQIQVTDEPFDGGPSSMPEPTQAALTPVDTAPEDQLEIPDDPKKRFRHRLRY